VTEEHTNEVIAPEVVVYDLDQKWKITLWDNGETDGLSTYPGSDKQFLIGRERGNTRDLYRIELPE
jgi:hypothetical protein